MIFRAKNVVLVLVHIFFSKYKVHPTFINRVHPTVDRVRLISIFGAKIQITLFVLPMSFDHCAGGLHSGYCLGNFSLSQKVLNVTWYTTNFVDWHFMELASLLTLAINMNTAQKSNFEVMINILSCWLFLAFLRPESHWETWFWEGAAAAVVDAEELQRSHITQTKWQTKPSFIADDDVPFYRNLRNFSFSFSWLKFHF